jgi:hypothetical protein
VGVDILNDTKTVIVIAVAVAAVAVAVVVTLNDRRSDRPYKQKARQSRPFHRMRAEVRHHPVLYPSLYFHTHDQPLASNVINHATALAAGNLPAIHGPKGTFMVICRSGRIWSFAGATGAGNVVPAHLGGKVPTVTML